MRINFTGCCLIDYLYDNINFSGKSFIPFISKVEGDGGIIPGKLVFADHFEKFAKMSIEDALNIMTSGAKPKKVNIGGPAVVAAIHTAQMLINNWQVRFYGGHGNDSIGIQIEDLIDQTPVNYCKTLLNGSSPFTWVLSDPTYDNGNGERAFVNNIGAMELFDCEKLGEDFFKTEINVYGGTALVPKIHSNLSSLLKKGKSRGNFQIVTTVYDFINQMKNPEKPWPMGDSDDSYKYIDLLITDYEEALRLSGCNDEYSALDFFLTKGAGSVVITNGVNDIIFNSNNIKIKKTGLKTLPVSSRIKSILKENPDTFGDTTGCGDNFAGGIISAIAMQIESGREIIDLEEAVPYGITAGGYACFYIGGAYLESFPGEKKKLIEPILNEYKNNLNF